MKAKVHRNHIIDGFPQGNTDDGIRLFVPPVITEQIQPQVGVVPKSELCGCRIAQPRFR